MLKINKIEKNAFGKILQLCHFPLVSFPIATISMLLPCGSYVISRLPRRNDENINKDNARVVVVNEKLE
jgi:hypothetical protein